MTPRRLALAVVLVVVASSVGVGAATPAGSTTASAGTPTTSTAANASASSLGQNISMVMQANAAQAEGAVENGMWAAAFVNASNASTKRALVERRVGQLNGTIAELQTERRALRAAFRNGTIDQATYRARLSTIVGRLAALDEGIDETSERGAAVGVNRSRLDQLRTQARNLSGAEVSRIARNLTGGPGPPAWAGGPGGERGSDQAGNETGPSTQSGPGEAGNTTRTADGPPDEATETGDSRGQGPPDDRGRDTDAESATPTATES